MHATDLVGINGITRVLLVYTCQQGVYPRDDVLPLRLPFFTITYEIPVAHVRATCPANLILLDLISRMISGRDKLRLIIIIIMEELQKITK
jgi:hypothetical protein